METENKKMISWDSVLDTTMKIPGIKVNREEFLNQAFSAAGSDTDFSEKRPIDYFDEAVIEKVAKDVINGQTLKVTSVSALAGIPGGFAILGTMPADIAQFYFHAIVLAQKLGYIYGWPNLLDDEGHLSEGTRNVLTIFIGVMMGAQTANKAITEIAKRVALEAAKRIPKQALTKTAWYPIIKSLGKWMGVQITKQSIGKGAGKIIPILGGVLSGGITLATFRPMANRLRNELRNEMYLFKSTDQHFYFESETEEASPLSDAEFEMIRIRACINIAKIDFDFSDSEKAFLLNMIENASLDDEDKAELLNELHQKELTDIDFRSFNLSDIQATSLIESLVSIVNIDGFANPEKIYLYKIAKDLNIPKSTVDDMLLTDRGL